MPRRRREPDAERTPVEMTDEQLDAFIERAIRDSAQSGDAGWRALRDWGEAERERDKRRFGRASGPILVRQEKS